jgi:hypothetical protein
MLKVSEINSGGTLMPIKKYGLKSYNFFSLELLHYDQFTSVSKYAHEKEHISYNL